MGYRHMIRWYALKLYDFLRDFGASPDGCQYQYVMRMDEDSFLHSSVSYDLFEYMRFNKYSYAFRLCALEMHMDVWEDCIYHVRYCGGSLPPGIPYRQLLPGSCGFYNNFFLLEIAFMLRPDVQHFLQWIDTVGIIYRERYGDLQTQTNAAYAFLPQNRIHRFLNWTYEHFTLHRNNRPKWGALQAGYLDTSVSALFDSFQREYFERLQCPEVTHLELNQSVLSPTYSHLPNSSWFEENLGVPLSNYSWKTFQYGGVEVPASGNLSG